MLAKDLKETLFSLSFCTFGDLLTGLTFGYFTHSLKSFPALIILIPPAIAMRGNIFSTLGSRLGTYLHTGEILIGRKSKLLNENIFSSLTLTFSMSFYLAFLSWLIAKHIGLKIDLISLCLISLLAGFFSAMFLLFFTFLIAFSSYRKGWNPDNVTAPLITLAGDIITLPLLFFSLEVVKEIKHDFQFPLFIIFLIASILSFYPIKMKNFKIIIKESLPIFMICGLLSTFSGFILGKKFEQLMISSAMLAIIPAFLEDGGAIGGILAARFSSALHTGELKEMQLSKKAVQLFLLMHLIGLIIFPMIGIFGFLVGRFLNLGGELLQMILISLLSGEILIFIVNFLAFYISMLSFKFGINPDNVAIPILTSLMDFIGTACLIGIAFTVFRIRGY